MIHVLRFMLFCVTASIATASPAKEAVILLHGMVRTDKSMARMAAALEKEGFVVLNVDYPSRTDTVEPLAAKVISAALSDPKLKDATRIHFVTHSLGGILVRQYLKT